jgi:hypothetical protein
LEHRRSKELSPPYHKMELSRLLWSMFSHCHWDTAKVSLQYLTLFAQKTICLDSSIVLYIASFSSTLSSCPKSGQTVQLLQCLWFLLNSEDLSLSSVIAIPYSFCSFKGISRLFCCVTVMEVAWQLKFVERFAYHKQPYRLYVLFGAIDNWQRKWDLCCPGGIF